MNIYDVYMDGEEAVISATGYDIDDEGRLKFYIKLEVVAVFQAHIWEWLEKRQVEETSQV